MPDTLAPPRPSSEEDDTQAQSAAETAELEELYNQPSFYKPEEAQKSRLGIGGGGGNKNLKRLGIGVGGVAAVVIGVVAFIMLLLGSLQSIHYATVLRGAGFAAFNLQMSSRFAQDIADISLDQAVLTPTSTGSIELESRTLGQRIRGINPEKWLPRVNENIRFDINGKNNFVGRKSNEFKAIEIRSNVNESFERFSLDDTAKSLGNNKSYNDLNFLQKRKVKAEFAKNVRSKLADVSLLEKRTVRNSVYDGIRQVSGIKMERWAKKGEKYAGKTPKEADKLGRTDSLEDVSKRTVTGDDIVDETTEDVNERVKGEIDKGTPEVDIAKSISEARESRLRISSIARDVSVAAFITTTYCIAHDLVSSFDEASKNIQQSAMRQGHSSLTTADQVVTGDTVEPAVSQDARNWNGADKSISYQRDIGNPDFQNAADADAPYVGLSHFQEIAGFVKSVDDKLAPGEAADTFRTNACSVITSPTGQVVAGVSEVIAAAFTAGSAEAGAQAGGRAIAIAVIKSLGKSGTEAAATVGVGEVAGQLLQAAVERFSGMQVSGIAHGGPLYSQSHVGVGLLAESNMQEGAYGRPLEPAEAVAVNFQAYQSRVEKVQQLPWQQRYFAITNPFSLTGRVAAATPTNLTGTGNNMASFFSGLGPRLFNGTSRQLLQMGNLDHQMAFAAAAANDDVKSGVPSIGYSLAEQSLLATDPDFQLQRNADIVEADVNLEYSQFEQQYGNCFTRSLDETMKDPKCNSTTLGSRTALHYRLYRGLDSYIVGELSKDYTKPVADNSTTTQAPQATNNKVYVLGDSYSVGLGTGNLLVDKLKAKGLETTIDASCGRPLGGTDQASRCTGTPADFAGLGALDQPTVQEKIKANDNIVVELGTNDLGGSADGLKTNANLMAQRIRTLNPKAKIYWVNFYLTSAPLSNNLTSFNKALAEAAQTSNFTIIDWASKAAGSYKPNQPHPEDYGAYADVITEAVAAGKTAMAPTLQPTVQTAGAEFSIGNLAKAQARQLTHSLASWLKQSATLLSSLTSSLILPARHYLG